VTRRGIDRAAIAERAARIADDEGVEAIAVPRLAADLGVSHPALYRHVAGVDGIRREVALFGVRELTEGMRDAAVGRAGDEAVRALAGAYRAYAAEHPGRYRLASRAPSPEDAEHLEAAAAAVAVVGRVLEGYGYQDEDLIHAIRQLRAALHGFVHLEATGGWGLPLDLDESFRRLIETLIAGLRTPIAGR
jgi:AcrR family transcriptional regulator